MSYRVASVAATKTSSSGDNLELMRAWCLIVVLTGCGRLGFDGHEPEEAVAERQVMYMPFDDDLVDEVTGSVATCTGTECPTYMAGVAGDAAVFDGVDDCVHVPWMTDWMPDQFTISASVRLDSMTAPVVIKNYSGACAAAALAVSNRSVGMMVIDVADEHQDVWSPPMIIAQEWHNLSIVWDGTQQQVFVDGTCACGATPPRRFAFNTSEITIGCYPDTGTLLTGAVDEVRIHSRALSPFEIAALSSDLGASPPSATRCATLCSAVAP